MCNQLLSEFSIILFETWHRYYKHIEDVHVTFLTKNNFDILEISCKYCKLVS